MFWLSAVQRFTLLPFVFSCFVFYYLDVSIPITFTGCPTGCLFLPFSCFVVIVVLRVFRKTFELIRKGLVQIKQF